MNLLHTKSHGVAEVVLNRPAVHNAFDEMMIAEITDAFNVASADPAIRVVALKANGPSFCGGADLAWMARMAQYTDEENLEDARLLQQMFRAIAHCPKVTIAAVQGAAIGGGAGLAAVCDVAIASSSAVFALSEVRLGLVPAVISPYIVERIGIGAARALFVTGERIDAAAAQRIGLVQWVVGPDELNHAVEKRVELALKAGPYAVEAAKKLLQEIHGLSPDDAAEITAQCIAELRVGPEGREGIAAFLEKRHPSFEQSISD